MPDVVLPVLNEREALPWVLERMPAGYEPIVVDNGSTDGSGALAAALGARVVHEPRPGFGAACFAGPARPRRADVVCFMDCDASLDPRELPRVADPVAAGARRPRARRAAAGRAAGRCTRGSPTALLALELRRRTGVRLTDLGPMRAARREALLALGHPRPPLRLAAGDGRCAPPAPAGGSTRSPSPTSARDGRSKVTGTVRGTAARRPRHGRGAAVIRRRPGAHRHVRPALLVIAKAPVPGRVKTRLTPPCTPEQAARAGRAPRCATRWPRPLRDARAGAARARARRRARRLAAARLRGRAAARRRARRARSPPRSRTPAARRSWSAWTRRRSRPRCSTPAWPRSRTPTPRSAPRSTAATGASACARPTRRCSRGVPMSAGNTGARPARAPGRRSACAPRSLPPLRDVDTIDDARAVAAEAPRQPLRRRCRLARRQARG